MNNISICVVSAAVVYLSLFMAVFSAGGLPEAKLFLNGTVEFLTINSWEAPRISFNNFCDKLLMSLAGFLVVLIDAVADNCSIGTFLIITIVSLFITGLIYDKQAVYFIVNSLFTPSRDGIAAIWKIVSDPGKLLSYILFCILGASLVKIIQGGTMLQEQETS